MPFDGRIALADHDAKAEIDRFTEAVSERFGERTLLSLAAEEPQGAAFEKAAAAMKSDERERLAGAWGLMRTGQQLAAEERTAVTLNRTEAERLGQRQGQAMQ
ncbi:hypothetical protein [Telmatospirillum sp.]|uniref:hypothetical protein n=1 Tax=Telmatospirillum sp. TaxID=2079197 RepID=UPI002852A9D1|nr:hypothetical protein [Telmatospirillum sp.]